MRLMLLLAALLFCGSALAFHCPMDRKTGAGKASNGAGWSGATPG
ncbi:hypothetical protein ACSZOI_05640 [Aeromonas caviae]